MIYSASEALRYGTCHHFSQFYLHTETFNPQSKWATGYLFDSKTVAPKDIVGVPVIKLLRQRLEMHD